MKNQFTILSLFALFASTQASAASSMTYFACTVEEPATKTRTVQVTVKFAVKNLDVFKEKGELVQYPGSNDEMGMILVEPEKIGRNRIARMTNLNGQGGDLRIEGDNLRLFGDGAGWQFTDLVIWDVGSSEGDDLEGYVRDYGPTYGSEETFKQFIKCQRSGEVL